MASSSKKVKLSEENSLSMKEKYFAIDLIDGYACLLCNCLYPYTDVKNEVEYHYLKEHWRKEKQYKANPSVRAQSLLELTKRFFAIKDNCKVVKSDSASVNKLAFKITCLIIKSGKSLTDGEVIKRLLLDVIPELTSLCATRINFISVANILPMSLNAMTRRIELIGEHLHHQLRKDVKKCDWYSLLIGTYKMDAMDKKVLLIVSIRMVFDDMSIKEELMDAVMLPVSSTGSDIYAALQTILRWKTGTPQKTMASITIDTASTILDRTAEDFVSCCTKDMSPSRPLFHKCLLHLAESCLDAMKMNYIVENVREMMDQLIRKSWKKEIFEKIMTDDNLELVMTFFANLPLIRASLDEIDVHFEQLDSTDWIVSLTFYVDLAKHVTKLLDFIRDDRRNVWEVVDASNQFRDQIVAWTNDFLKNRWPESSFPRTQSAMCELDEELHLRRNSFLGHLEALHRRVNEALTHFYTVMDFSKSLGQSFDTSKSDIKRFVRNLVTAGIEISGSITDEFENLAKHCKLIGMTNKPEDVWKVIKKETYPNIVSMYQRNLSTFGTGSMNRAIVKRMNEVKAINKIVLSDDTVREAVRIIMSLYQLDYVKLTEAWNSYILNSVNISRKTY